MARTGLSAFARRHARRGWFRPGPPAAGAAPRAWMILLVAALIAVGYAAWLATWNERTPSGLVMSGYVQGDMPTYVCYAQATRRSATTLSYASPHDVRADAPAMLVNLPISLMGWLLSAGVPPGAVGQILRVIFGTAMLFVLGLALRRLFRSRALFWPAFVIVGVGAGVSWTKAWYDAESLPTALFEPVAWLDALAGPVRALEAEHYWWFLDVFRNLTYPLETLYHALVFAQLLGLASGRWRLAGVAHALGCLSNPFVGIQMCGVQVGTLIARGLRVGGEGARVSLRPEVRRPLAAALAVSLAFVVYYAWWLPRDPAIASLQAQHAETLAEALGLESVLLGYGPALLGVGALVVDRRFRRAVFVQERALLPFAALALWTLVLSQNSRLPFDAQLMPMHFTRGYFHVGAWVLALAWLRTRAATWPRWTRRVPWVFAAMALVLLPDNVLFARARHDELPQQPHLVWDTAHDAVLQDVVSERAPRRVIAQDEALGRQVCAFSQHRSAFGTALTTPHHFDRRAQMEAFLADPSEEPPLVRWADRVVLPGHATRVRRTMEESGRWRARTCNRAGCVMERVGDPEDAADSVPSGLR